MYPNSEALTIRRGRPGRWLSVIALVALIAGLMPALASGHAYAQSNCQTFAQTNQTVCGKFLDYWNNHGGLAQQGYPISPELQEKSDTDGKTYTTQYFERAVFEAHPENQAPYDVLLQLLGVFTYQQRYGKAGAPNQTVSTTNAISFSQTGHSLGGVFRDYWESHGGLAQQGYPISDEFQEKSQTDGKTYTVQYFERAAFEEHPENQPPNNVLLSLLGTFRWQAKQTPAVKYPGANADLTGTGSTFVLPAMSDWAQRYNQLYSGVKVNYQGTGSGNGRTQFLAKTVDFAGTDAPLSDAQLQQAGGPDQALHIPVVMGGVVMAYNVPGVTTQLKLNGATIANIYLLTITNWNDPAIAALNPGVTLPDLPIAVSHRSDGSGTTDIFTDYLSKVSSDWKSKVGRGTIVPWPGGIGGQGNDGVTQLVKQTEGGIGYIELAYAKQNNIPYALVKNQAGNFIDASPQSVSEAASSSISSLPADLRYSITNAPGQNAYPIAGTTWLLVYVNQTDANKGKALAYFIWWITHDGQQFSEKLLYAPLPAALVTKDEAQIKKLMCGLSPCFP